MRCGACRGRHELVDQVRECYARRAPAAEPAPPPSESSSSGRDGETPKRGPAQLGRVGSSVAPDGAEEATSVERENDLSEPVTFCPWCASDERVEQAATPPRCEVHGVIDQDGGDRVYVSQGWKAVAYHRSQSCRWLRRGQAGIASSGGTPASIIMVSRMTALGRGLAECQHCFRGSRVRP